jgi:hypothetical protein
VGLAPHGENRGVNCYAVVLSARDLALPQLAKSQWEIGGNRCAGRSRREGLPAGENPLHLVHWPSGPRLLASLRSREFPVGLRRRAPNLPVSALTGKSVVGQHASGLGGLT